jgi:hypothetical protein
MKALFVRSSVFIAVLALLLLVTSVYPGDIYAQGNLCTLSGNELRSASANLHSVGCDATSSEDVALAIEAGRASRVPQPYQAPTDRLTDDRSFSHFNTAIVTTASGSSVVYLPTIIK